MLMIAFFAFIATGLHMVDHDFVGAEETYLVSQSESLRNMYACKDECLGFKNTLPFQLKYHRLVLSQLNTDHKYLEGHCFFSPNDQEWTPIEKLPNYITPPENLPLFLKTCENHTGELSPSILDLLEFSRIHSLYEFYSNGTFINLHKTNINGLLSKLVSEHII